MLKPRNNAEILTYLTLGYVAFAEILSWETSKWGPPCLVASEYQQASNQANYETCATLHEGIAFLSIYINHDNITAAATVFIALFTLTLWLSNEKMWGVTKMSVAAANRSADIAERALTELEAPFAFVDITTPGIGITPDGGGVSWGPLQWTVVNYGRTPALLLETLGEIRIIPFEQFPDPVRPGERQGQQLPFGVVAPPNGGRSNRGFDPVEAALTQTGPPGQPFTTHSPFFLGFVRYEDILGQRFALGFCFIFDRRSGTWIRILGDDYNYRRPEN